MNGLGLGEIELRIREQTAKLNSLKDEAKTSRVRFCLELTALIYGVELSDILQAGRSDRRISDARQLSMYLANVSFGLGFGEISWFTGRDRATVRYGVERVEDRRENPGYDALVSCIELLIVKLLSDPIATSISEGVRVDLGADPSAIDEIWQQPLGELEGRDA